MTNVEIIMAECLAHEIPAEEELNTFARWKALGYSVKKGEKGIETRLWKKSKPKQGEDTSDEDKSDEEKAQNRRGFYMCKAFLFRTSQVEKLEVVNG